MWDLIKKQGGYLEENKFYLGINPTTVSSPRFKKKATETKGRVSPSLCIHTGQDIKRKYETLSYQLAGKRKMRGGIFQKNNILRDFCLISRNVFSYPYSHLLSPFVYKVLRKKGIVGEYIATFSLNYLFLPPIRERITKLFLATLIFIIVLLLIVK